jgi:hypothetical protein
MTKSEGTKVRHAQSVTGLCPLDFVLFLTPFLGTKNNPVLEPQL